jgi:hypothetical protein
MGGDQGLELLSGVDDQGDASAPLPARTKDWARDVTLLVCAPQQTYIPHFTFLALAEPRDRLFPGRVMCCAFVCGVANDASSRNAIRIFRRVTRSSSCHVTYGVQHISKVSYASTLCNETDR